jgi:hypothetical protein
VDGVICFSAVKKTKNLPKYNKVYTPYSQLWYKTFENLEVKEPGETELYGVTFTARDHFLEVYETRDGLDGKYFPVYQAMKDKAAEYTKAYREANKVKTTVSELQLTVGGNSTFAYDKETNYFLHAILVQSETINNEDYYVINISQQFKQTEADLYSLKALCYYISSTPETLYNVITYDLFEYPVVPGIPGLKNGSVGEEWVGEIGREYGDFAICVNEGLNVDTILDKYRDLYPGLPVSYLSGNSYYVKKAD